MDCQLKKRFFFAASLNTYIYFYYRYRWEGGYQMPNLTEYETVEDNVKTVFLGKYRVSKKTF